MNRRTILVSGASGFIGHHLLPLLIERDWEVHATSIEKGMPGIPSRQWHQADLLIPGEARRLVTEVRPSVLIHLAWFVAPGRWADAPENLDWVRASIELAREFVNGGGNRMIVSGSCLEYDWNYGYCSEMRTPCTPHTLYGTAKNSLRLILEPFMTQAGCSLAWGRVFFLYGPYEHHDRLVASVIRSLIRAEPARCSHGGQIRDYLYAEDVAAAFAAIASSNIRGNINIASGQPVTLKSIVDRIGNMIGRSDLIQYGAIPQAPSDTPLVVGDPARLVDELGWKPAYSLDDGLMRTIDWWRRQ